MNKVDQMMIALTTGNDAGNLQIALNDWLVQVRLKAGLAQTDTFSVTESAVLFVWLGINAVTNWNTHGYGDQNSP